MNRYKNITAARVICFTLLLSAFSFRAAAQDFPNSINATATRGDPSAFNAAEIQAFLQNNFSRANSGMVIGTVDEHGSRLFCEGRLDNSTGAMVDGDTVFEIGSITKTFTALVLLDMVERGEMKLEDPVSLYLPKSVKMPAHGNKPITLLHLAAQDSGLPFNADNLTPGDWVKAYNAYTAADLYAFLSSYVLTEDPGTRFQYSNVGMSLLGHVMELKAAASFESLVLNRVCRPLGMSNTCITLPPRLKAHLAMGHDPDGRPAPYYEFQVMTGAGALLSTASDLLQYVSANLGLTPSGLRPLMDKMQVIRHHDSPDMGKTAMPWYNEMAYNPPETELLGHGGGTGGCSTFIGFDKRQRRGVVVLSNQRKIHSSSVGWRLLQGAPFAALDAATLQPLREYVATGLTFAPEKQTGIVRITNVYPNTPAAKAGLSPGLIIDKINGVSAAGKSLAEALELMRGPIGTKVRLVLIAPDGSHTNTVELTKQKILL